MLHNSGGQRDMDVETLQNRVYKSPPRPRKRRRRFVWRKTVWPLVKLTTVAALAFFVVSAVVSWVAHPIKLLNSEYRETQRLACQLGDLKEQNAVLDRRIKHLKSAQGAEQVARKLGYVKPGEITLVIPE
jgi:cell division protein FtsB